MAVRQTWGEYRVFYYDDAGALAALPTTWTDVGEPDPRDVVQVKYEMIRRVEVEAQAVAPTAAAFHFSRPSFYQAQRAFQQRGLAGLLPKKRGPRGGHKLTAEIVTFLQGLRDTEPSLRPAELAHRIAERFDTTVHPRSIERALARQEKKRQR